MTLKAVAFDIDGTLYPNRKMYARSIPFGIRNMRLMRVFGRVRKKLRTIRPIDDFYTLQAQLVAEELGTSYEATREKIDRVIYGEWEQVLNSVPIYPGVMQFIHDLRARGVRIGVMSDFPVHTKLRVLKLDGLWDAEVSAEETGYLKPSPEPFRVLSQNLGVDPEQTLYIGNSYHYDVVGAATAGMYTAHLESRTVPPAEILHGELHRDTDADIRPNMQFRQYPALQQLVTPYIHAS